MAVDVDLSAWVDPIYCMMVVPGRRKPRPVVMGWRVVLMARDETGQWEVVRVLSEHAKATDAEHWRKQWSKKEKSSR
jgi:hypothetical protein